MSKIIVVVGVTGTQGGSVARKFSKIPGWEVRGVTRNPNSAAALELKELGVTLVKADLGDVESLKTAFTGANAIFGVTDFWQFVQSPITQEIAKSKGITWNEACYIQEVEHGKNIIDAAAQVVKQGSLERLVVSSLSDAKKASKGKYTWVYHFDSKAHFVQYLEEKSKEDEQYRSLFEKTSYVQIGSYMDNWRKNPIFAPKKSADGSFVFHNILPDSLAGSVPQPTPFVHPSQDTGPFVEALVLKAPPRTTMLGTSTLIQYSQYIKLWGEINGVKTTAQSMTVEEADEMWPHGIGIEVAETVCFVSEYGWDGGEGAVLPEELGVNKEELSDLVSYIKTTDWSSVLN